MNFIANGRTHKGRVRPHNEDDFIIEPSSLLFAVADGVGGAAAGEVASHIFIKSCINEFPERHRDYEETLQLVERCFIQADQNIKEYVQHNPDLKGMGCTGELLTFFDDNYLVGHVGDSRCYLLRDGKLEQLSKDHSLIQEQIDKGIINQDEAQQHWLKNSIYRAVGHLHDNEVDLIRGKTLPGDIFLLCSDGLTDMVLDNRIEQLLTMDSSLTAKVSGLTDEANHNGGSDNITVVLVEVRA